MIFGNFTYYLTQIILPPEFQYSSSVGYSSVMEVQILANSAAIFFSITYTLTHRQQIFIDYCTYPIKLCHMRTHFIGIIGRTYYRPQKECPSYTPRSFNAKHIYGVDAPI